MKQVRGVLAFNNVVVAAEGRAHQWTLKQLERALCVVRGKEVGGEGGGTARVRAREGAERTLVLVRFQLVFTVKAHRAVCHALCGLTLTQGSG
jgi:hypothetical protein